MKVAKISTKYLYIYFIVIYNEGERKVISNECLFDANQGAVCGGIFLRTNGLTISR